MSAARDTSFGSYSRPTKRAPQTYGQLQEHVFAQRERHTSGAQAQRRVETEGDLATMLQEFASDGTVLRALQDFALPAERRKKAASQVTLLQSTPIFQQSRLSLAPRRLNQLKATPVE